MSFNSSSRLDFLSYLQLLFYPDFVLLSEQISHDEAGDGATGWIYTIQAIRCNIPACTILHHPTRANVNTPLHFCWERERRVACCRKKNRQDYWNKINYSILLGEGSVIIALKFFTFRFNLIKNIPKRVNGCIRYITRIFVFTGHFDAAIIFLKISKLPKNYFKK